MVSPLIILSLLVTQIAAVTLDPTDVSSVCNASTIVMNGEWNYYEGLRYGGTVGMFQPPYYWWNAGEAFGGMLDHWYYCAQDNDTLKQIIYDAMYHQAGEDFNYIPSNQSLVEGNDDQGVWGLTVMAAVERNFTNPDDHGWLYMAQAIYNTMNSRWDSATCGGGLRWQIFTWNSGYNYKNSIANGCLFHIAARLARYTGNDTYAETAERVWDWMVDVGYMVYLDDGFTIYDGADVDDNCTSITQYEWSYTYGVFMAGAAYLYDYTNDTKWLTRTQDILTASSYFFNDGVMWEHTCQASDKCNNDQRSFRSLFARCLGLTAIMAPETEDTIMAYITTSAQAAAQSCSGGSDGVTCGEDWSFSGWDGKYGLGEQMSALETIQALLIHSQDPPYTADNGGTSEGDSEAGIGTGSDSTKFNVITITQKDKVGAGILTAVVLAALLAGAVWMII